MNEYSNYTMAELRTQLSHRGLITSGKKVNLIGRLSDSDHEVESRIYLVFRAYESSAQMVTISVNNNTADELKVLISEQLGYDIERQLLKRKIRANERPLITDTFINDRESQILSGCYRTLIGGKTLASEGIHDGDSILLEERQ